VGDYDSLDSLRLSLREQLEEQAKGEAARDYAGQVVERLVDESQIDYPEEMVQRILDRMLFDENIALQRQGLNLDLYLRMEGKTREQLREERHEDAQARLRNSLVLGEVAKLEGLEVSPMEVISYIRLVSSAYGDQAEEMRRTMLASEPFQESVRQDLLADKATARLVSIAKGEAELAAAAAEDALEPSAETEVSETAKAGETEEEIGKPEAPDEGQVSEPEATAKSGESPEGPEAESGTGSQAAEE
jgi:FKBP-type peptidyl-prolyl cis-trans isomerase (trigger factor)